MDTWDGRLVVLARSKAFGPGLKAWLLVDGDVLKFVVRDGGSTERLEGIACPRLSQREKDVGRHGVAGGEVGGVYGVTTRAS